MFNELIHDESGVIISAELVLVLTIGVLSMVVGLSELAVSVTSELNDVSNAMGALNQSYAFTGFVSLGSKTKAIFVGTTFIDSIDDCDLTTSCDLIVGASATPTLEGVSL